MAEYFGYKKRESPNMVDWVKVSKKITDNLEAKEKQKAADALSVISKDEELEKFVSGLSPTSNPDAQSFFSNTGFLFGDVNQQLKDQFDSGDIDAKEYNRMYQSLYGQYELFKNFNTTYSTAWSDYTKAYNGNIASPTMIAVGAQLESLGNINKLETKYKDGKFVYQRHDDSGQPIGQAMSMMDLNSMLVYNNKPFAVNDFLADDKKTLTQKTGVQSVNGIYTTNTTDPTINANFDDTVLSISEGRFNKSGIDAANFLSGVKKTYDVSFEDYDPNKQNDTIFLKFNSQGQPEVVEQQRDEINKLAAELYSLALKGTQTFSKITTSKTQSPATTQGVQSLNQGSNFLKNVNNLLTSSNNPGSALNVIAKNVGANDIDYVLDDDDNITSYKFSDFKDGRALQTVELFDGSGNKKSSKKIAEEIYAIYSTDPKGTTKSKRAAFTDSWSKSGLTDLSDYSSAKVDVFNKNTDLGERNKNLSKVITLGIGNVTSPEKYLASAKGKGDYKTLYESSFKVRKTKPYVPKVYQGNAKVTDTGSNINIKINEGTRFRHSPLEFNIPKNIPDSEHILVQEAINNVLWSNQDLRKKAEFLNLLDAELKKLIPGNTITIQ